MKRNNLQQLLRSEDYCNFEDVVLVEGYFIQFIDGEPFRQVILGLTPENFLMAERKLPDLKTNPEVMHNTEIDLDLEGLELIWLIPVCFVQLSVAHKFGTKVLRVDSDGKQKYFEPANVQESPINTWNKWSYRIKYIHDDPYGYIKNVYEKCEIPYNPSNTIKVGSLSVRLPSNWTNVVEKSLENAKDLSETVRLGISYLKLAGKQYTKQIN